MPKDTQTQLLEQPPGALVPAVPLDTEAELSLFERLARDPNASVEKIERLMGLWERAQARKAETAFNAALTDAQTEIRPAVKDDYNPQTQSKFASYEALDAAARPFYTKHGFGLSFDTGEALKPEDIRILCYCSHRGGHSRTYHVDMPADGKGARGGDVMTKTHAAGSAVSYGMRYLLKMIFNIPTRDDDGNAAGGRPRPDTRQQYDDTAKPLKFDDKWTDLEAAADEGTAAFDRAWADMSGAFKNYVLGNCMDKKNALAKRAAEATKKAAKG